MRSILRFSFVFLLLSPTWARGESPDDTRVDALSKLITANAAFNESLASLALAYGQNQLNAALADKNYAVADAIRLRMATLRYEFDRIREKDQDLNRTLRSIETRFVSVNYYFRRSQVTKHAVEMYFDLAMIYLPAKVGFELLFAKVPPLDVKDFVSTRPGGDGRVLPFAGGNVGQFLRFLANGECTTVEFSGAHQELFKTVVSVQEVMSKYVEQAEAQRILIRASIADAFWKYPVK